MSKIKEAAGFGCPDCQSAIQIDYIVYDGDVKLLGRCEKCDKEMVFLLDAVIARLFDKHFVPTKGQPS